jgi:carbamate kinase
MKPDRTSPLKPILLVALGGNALVKKGQQGSAEQMLDNLRIPMGQIARLSKDYRIIITHGNGPQIGNLLLQQECCDAVPRMPLEILVAQTQGQIGYMIESILDSELMGLGVNTQPLVSLISYVVVDEKDPAFKDPLKPIGPVYSDEKAAIADHPVLKTAKGYRRAVVSPKPVTIVEKREIKKLIEGDFIVICCGGGGIPVIREGRAFSGVEAVIDKDLVSAKLAEEIGVDMFIIATDETGVFLNYGKKDQAFLSRLTMESAARHMLDGQFPAGSMGPKVEAAMQFINKHGKKVAITSLENIEAAVMGRAGTEIVAD